MRASVILKSVTATWLAVVISAVATFVLTPLVLHRLGDEAYGIWVLTVSITEYYTFLQVGVRSAIVRYVSRNLALEDLVTVTQVVATSFYFYLLLAGLLLLVVSSFAPYVSKFFSVSATYRNAFVGLFVILGVTQAFDFLLSLSEGSLEAIGRFDQLYGIRIAGIILRVITVLVVLR